MKKNLEHLQAELRLRTTVQKIVEKPAVQIDQNNKPLCTNCIAIGKAKPRVCRRGSNLCSRCTMKGIESQLRDVLPGMRPVDEKKELEEVEKHFEEEVPVEEVLNAEHEVEHAEEMIRKSQIPSIEEEIFDLSKGNYTRREVSKMVGVSPTTICRWEQKGVVPIPKRIAHNNQLLYTDEIVEALKKYKNEVVSVQYTPTVPKSPQEIAAKNLVKKTFKLNKKAEKVVARTINISGFRSGRLM